MPSIGGHESRLIANDEPATREPLSLARPVVCRRRCLGAKNKKKKRARDSLPFYQLLLLMFLRPPAAAASVRAAAAVAALAHALLSQVEAKLVEPQAKHRRCIDQQVCLLSGRLLFTYPVESPARARALSRAAPTQVRRRRQRSERWSVCRRAALYGNRHDR